MELVQTEDRQTILARYRCLRAVTIELHSQLMRKVGGAALLAHARKLGLVHGGTIVADFDVEMPMVLDLAIYTAPPGRSTAVHRTWGKTPPQAGSDEAAMVRAMSSSRFSFWRAARRHPVCGTMVSDLVTGEDDAPDIWLMDEGIEASLPIGGVLALRLVQPDAFAMTTGVIVPVSEDLLLSMDPWALERHKRGVPGTDAKLPTEVFRAALETGATENVRYRDSEDSIEDFTGRLRA